MERGEYTFTMIKPNALISGHLSSILKVITDAGFSIVALKITIINKQQAERFYRIHKERDFFDMLTTFMSTGPIGVAIIKKQNAVEDYRKLIGSTDPAKADEGTIRKMFGISITQNAVHGSDSESNAYHESCFFFNELEIFEQL